MNYKEKFNEIMNENKVMAIASCVDGIPNVRLVNFVLKGNKVYFMSGPDSEKVDEFRKNNTVSFTTIPLDNETHVRVKSAKIEVGKTSAKDIMNDYLKKLPENNNIPREIREAMLVCEITIEKATVILSMSEVEEIEL